MPRSDRADHATPSTCSSSACRSRSGSCARAIYWAREACVLGMVARAALLKGRSCSRKRFIARRSPTRELRAQGHAGLHDRLQAHPDLQRLLSRRSTSRTSRSSPTASREVRGNAVVAPTAPSARSTRSSSAPASTSPTRRWPQRVRGRDGRALAEAWEAQPQAHRGTTVAGFPNLFHARRAEHRPRPQLDRLHDREPAELRRRTRCARCARRARDASRSDAEAQARYNDGRPAARCRGPSGSPAAARAGTSTRRAATRRCGRASPSASAS